MTMVELANDAHDHKGRFAPKGQGVSFQKLPDGWDAGGDGDDLGLLSSSVDPQVSAALDAEGEEWLAGSEDGKRRGVLAWTQGSYTSIREHYAGTLPPEVANDAGFREQYDRFTSDLAAAPDVDGVFYRGVHKGSSLHGYRKGWEARVGSSIDITAPSSTSTRATIGYQFAAKTLHDPVVFQIRGKGKWVGPAAEHRSEKEVIIPAGSYKVDSVHSAKIDMNNAIFDREPARATIVRLVQQ